MAGWQLVVVRPALPDPPHVVAGAEHDGLQAVHVVEHGVHRPHPAVAIGDAVAAAQLAEGVAGEGVQRRCPATKVKAA